MHGAEMKLVLQGVRYSMKVASPNGERMKRKKTQALMRRKTILAVITDADTECI